MPSTVMLTLILFHLFSHFIFLLSCQVHLLNFLLECNCFTVLGQFLLYNEVNQLCDAYIPSLSLPPSRPIPPCRSLQGTKLTSLGCTTVSHQRCLTYDSAYMSMLLSQLSPPSPSPTVSTNLFSMSVSLFLPWKIGSLLPFFQIPYACVNMQYLFYSF